MPRIAFGANYTPPGGSTTDFTSRILSIRIRNGREKYLDNYSGGTIIVTIDNSNNFAAGITYGSTLQVANLASPPGTEYNLIGWVQEVTYQDVPGGRGLNTATITAADWFSRSGRVQATAFPITQAKTGTQIKTFEAPGPLPSDMTIIATSLGQSTGSTITYTGTVLNYLNLIQTTERGYFVTRGTNVAFIGRDLVSTFPIPSVSLARDTSTTQIGYQQFARIQNGTQFINTATISSTGLADQTSTNSSSVSSYGPAFYSSQTVDFSTTQASGNASWIVNNFSDPAALRFEVEFSDVAQNTTALNSWMAAIWGTFNRLINLTYTAPGGSPVTTTVVIEGHDLSISSDQSVFRLYLSPLSYYQFFTLNSSTLGVLDTSRLGW